MMMRWLAIGVSACASIFIVVALLSSRSKQIELGRYTTLLTMRMSSQKHNAQIAIKKINQVVIKAGEEFSFNKTVGSWLRTEGYVKAPVSYSGTMISSWGGGVCQVSTTLYNAALLAGMEIIERHPHEHAPNYCPPGRDAAVSFNGVDLKFKNPHPFAVCIKASSDRSELNVQMLGKKSHFASPKIYSQVIRITEPSKIEQKRSGNAPPRLRCKGKAGCEALVWKFSGDRKVLISQDHYCSMPIFVR
jgi:vancomycin resistance protein VanW